MNITQTASAATAAGFATEFTPEFAADLVSNFGIDRVSGLTTGSPQTVAWSDMVAHRSYLVRFAQRKLRDPLMAEDAVHDVFEAVLAGRAVFSGRAALRSWLTAVLKNKIVDSVRRNPNTDSLGEDDDGDDRGAMAVACSQPGPAEVAEQHQLLSLVLNRIAALPPGLRDAMQLRVLEDRSTEDVCRALGISEENLFVRIHRARKQLLS